MCGIAGFAAAPGRPTLAEERLRAMADAIAHRGPDGDGFHVHGGVSLAHRRLAIIDVAGGDNPLRDAEGRAVLMYNGEIWNHLALRAELEALGARPLTHSDGEIVLHGLLHWGLPETLRRVRGMYAFAVHDLRSGELHVARDPFGIKPLHWRQTADGLAFGSEIRAVLAAGGPTPRLDRRGLLQCATLGFTLAPRTAFEGVQALPPGHMATWHDGRLTLRRHHELRWEPGRERADARELWKRLSDTVASHLMSEVPLGAFLSGGVDSSAVVAAMAGRAREVDAVCVGILEPGLDERPYAREVAAALKVRLHEETAAPELAELLPRLVRHLEAPFADTSAAPTFLVCEAARRHVTVALSGDGGDENFAGYRRTRYDVVEQRWRARIPDGLRQGLLGPLGRAWPRGAWLPQPLRAGTLLTHLADDWLGAYVDSMARVGESRARELLAPDVADPAPLRADFEPHAARAQALDPLHRVLAMDFATWLPDDILVKTDRMSMAHGLEVRVPLLDTDFVDWAAGLPGEARLLGGRGKILLRQALAARVPSTVLLRGKQGFHLPVAAWLRGALRPRLQELLADERAPARALLRTEPLARLAGEHLSGAHDHAPELWFALCLDAFVREFPGVA
ncbi:MAG TPA: asparagine synthase (glutamine-hydrolyzing) [Planctomycetota bacterium]|nr:asparagine synthase (glutamine-hydrolyzing) [Planctomycetota bacterium]